MLLRLRWREVDPLDRAFTLGSRLFIAVLPLSLVAQQVTAQDTSVGELLTSTFGLGGAGQEAAERLFAPSGTLGTGLGLFALIVLIYAVRGFARSLQRFLASVWRIEMRGGVAVAAQVGWAIWLAAYVVVDIALAGVRRSDGTLAGPATIASTALFVGMWAVTPSMLLARRITFRRLLPSIVLTVIAVTLFDVVSRGYFPTIATSNAERYGLIGFAFSLFTWFFVNQAVVVLAAFVGAFADEVLRTR